MSDLTQLYQEIILRHNKYPRNYRIPEQVSEKAELNNPLCGDEIEVFWAINDGLIEEISFQARGCAISRASASIMTEMVRGKTVPEAKTIFAKISEFFNKPGDEGAVGEDLGELNALSGVKAYPSRIKCALLAWHAFLDNAE